MKTLKKIVSTTVMLIVMVSFSQCSSTKKLQEQVAITFGDVYCQKWIAGIKEGGSGLNIIIPTSNTSIKLDSVYFRGKAAKLEIKSSGDVVYIAKFLSSLNTKQDIIMSSNPKAEYGNKLPVIQEKIPFELKDTECVISYKKGNKTQYFKITNVLEKDLLAYPSAPPRKQ